MILLERRFCRWAHVPRLGSGRQRRRQRSLRRSSSGPLLYSGQRPRPRVLQLHCFRHKDSSRNRWPTYCRSIGS
jgi:hypothetical protein